MSLLTGVIPLEKGHAGLSIKNEEFYADIKMIKISRWQKVPLKIEIKKQKLGLSQIFSFENF
jgi:hypothetical protein